MSVEIMEIDDYMHVEQALGFLAGYCKGAGERLAKLKAAARRQKVYVLIEPGQQAVLGLHIVSDQQKARDLIINLTGPEMVPIDEALMKVDNFIDELAYLETRPSQGDRCSSEQIPAIKEAHHDADQV
jgi:hypothetical protein